MRIALVSPYSWTYPGGVTRHIEALAQQYLAEGHDVRVLAPFDPPDRASKIQHRGARPQPMRAPDYLIPLGRTIGFHANGAVSNLAIGPNAMARLSRELSSGRYDVAHIHEPIAPMIGWVATNHSEIPLVGTFHSYSAKRIPNTIASAFGARQMLNHLHVRIAVSEAAAWTGKRWFGGRYTVVPNGVHVDQAALDRALVDAERRARAHHIPEAEVDRDTLQSEVPLRLLFVGQAVERKGLPLLLRAFEALREHIPVELTVIGPSADEIEPLMMDSDGIRVLGKVNDPVKHAELLDADVLCAPSLGGESFGMVLTEAFAAGTMVVASDIAGYRDVVTDGVDGVLVPPADPQALAEALRDIYHEPDHRLQMARTAAKTVQRFSWDRVAAQVMESYTEAIATPAPVGTGETFRVRAGLTPADMKPRVPAQRLPSLDGPLAVAHMGFLGYLRRAGLAIVSLAGVCLGYLALQKIGIDHIVSALLGSSPTFVLLGLVAMCLAMLMRAVAWDAILKAALPKSRIRLIDAIQGTMIGVLMSSTLPARLGEPSRALVVARRSGRPRENLPVVLGTVVSQTLLNIVALIILGAIMFSSVDFFNGHENALLVVAVAPLALLVFVLLAPVLLRYFRGHEDSTRFQRTRRAVMKATAAMRQVRAGLSVFQHPRLGAIATSAQLAAWALQCLSCYLLLHALGVNNTGIPAAAAVLFAVNVSAVLPATPANLGVFQAACAAVLHAGWHVGYGTGVAYGVILQAVEIATALLMGMPALLKEGMSWREVRLRALHSTPIKLPPRVPGGSLRVRGRHNNQTEASGHGATG